MHCTLAFCQFTPPPGLVFKTRFRRVHLTSLVIRTQHTRIQTKCFPLLFFFFAVPLRSCNNNKKKEATKRGRLCVCVCVSGCLYHYTHGFPPSSFRCRRDTRSGHTHHPADSVGIASVCEYVCVCVPASCWERALLYSRIPTRGHTNSSAVVHREH